MKSFSYRGPFDDLDTDDPVVTSVASALAAEVKKPAEGHQKVVQIELVHDRKGRYNLDVKVFNEGLPDA